MSKLFLLISLMSFISIKAFADNGEDKIKMQCGKESGGYSSNPRSPYQQCLRTNGVIRVNRNINSSDSSQSDAVICNRANPICRQCISEYGSYDTSTARTKITECVQAEERKQRQAKADADAAKKRKQHDDNKIYDGGRLKEVVVTAHACSKKHPESCVTQEKCKTANGVWDGKACAVSPCPTYTTADENKSSTENLCKCDNDTNYWVERGTQQVCPSACSAEDRKEYNMVARSCVCMSGYHDPSGAGVCLTETASSPTTTVADCPELQELQDKATSCGNSATNAVNKCDADKKSTSGDTIGMMQSLLKGATDVMGAGGAADNCSNAAIAGSTGYYALDALREKCDDEINSCKTSCTDSTTYINANKERVYQACRAKTWDYYYGTFCRSGAPYPELDVPTEAAFNTRWDADKKPEFEQKIQQMLTSISDSGAKCQSGTAVTNREKMMGYMDDANNAVRSANQCQCQLSSGGGDCSKAPGPADCAANPSLTGCAQATVNCLSANDNSPKCACFKNPNSNECKNIASAVRSAGGNASGFAGGGAAPTGAQSAMTGFGGSGDSSSGKTGTDVSGDLSGLNSNEIGAAGGSDTTTADNGNPFAAAGGAGGSGGGSQGGAADGSSAKTEGEGSDSKGFRGLFETAKSALGGLFKDKRSDKGTYTGADGITRDADGNPISAANKWRPRGMVRGLAGNETSIGGKFEDIWKVMNKQYKVQDQKDSFIFGEKN